MKHLFNKYKSLLPLLAVLALYLIALRLLGITCPIKWATGISCPGCGMTRAVFSCLRLDFAAAFYYHPLWCLLPPAGAALLILHEKEKTRAFHALLYAVAAAFIAVYVCRMLWGDGVIVSFLPRASLPARIVDFFRN